MKPVTVRAAREIAGVRVVVGPKILGKGYARIVAQKDGSGRIESFNLLSGKWFPAPDSVTFMDVWCAPMAPFDLLPDTVESS